MLRLIASIPHPERTCYCRDMLQPFCIAMQGRRTQTGCTPCGLSVAAQSLVHLLREAGSLMLPWLCCLETEAPAAAFRQPYMHKVLESVERLLDSPLPLMLLLPACLCTKQAPSIVGSHTMLL